MEKKSELERAKERKKNHGSWGSIRNRTMLGAELVCGPQRLLDDIRLHVTGPVCYRTLSSIHFFLPFPFSFATFFLLHFVSNLHRLKQTCERWTNLRLGRNRLPLRQLHRSLLVAAGWIHWPDPPVDVQRGGADPPWPYPPPPPPP